MSYRNVTRVLSVVALSAGLVPATMVAQSASYVQQLQGYMNNYASPVMSRGFQAVTQMVTGGLNSSANGSHPVSLNAGRSYVILGVCDNDCTDVDLRLYGPDGSTVIQDLATDDHPTLNFTAPSTGNYRLEVIMATCRQSPCYYGVQLFGGSSTGAALNQPTNIQPINTGSPTQMGQIAINQQVSGNLTTMDGRWDNKPTQTWAFACQTGQAFQMNVLSTWDNYAIVIDPMGNVVGRDDDSGEGLNARVEHTCAMTGVYRLGVTTYQSSTTPGSYTMQIQGVAMATPMNTPVPMAAPTSPVTQSAPGATMPAAAAASLPITGGIPAPGQVGSVTVGTNVQGRLETGDQRMNDGTWADVWQFQGMQGQRIIIELRSEEFDTYVQLLDAQGNRLAEDDDSLGNLDSKVEFTLPAAGMYQIVVNNFSDERRAGIYTLSVR